MAAAGGAGCGDVGQSGSCMCAGGSKGMLSVEVEWRLRGKGLVSYKDRLEVPGQVAKEAVKGVFEGKGVDRRVNGSAGKEMADAWVE